jgi:hypothetical protein
MIVQVKTQLIGTATVSDVVLHLPGRDRRPHAAHAHPEPYQAVISAGGIIGSWPPSMSSRTRPRKESSRNCDSSDRAARAAANRATAKASLYRTDSVEPVSRRSADSRHIRRQDTWSDTARPELAKHGDPRARAIVRCVPSTHRYDARVAFTSPESRGGAGNKCADQHRYSDED